MRPSYNKESTMSRDLSHLIPHKRDEDLMKLLHNANKHRDAEIGHQVASQVFAEWRSRSLRFMNDPPACSLEADGVLSAFGYRVGEFGVRDSQERLRILRLIFDAEIPPINDPYYVRSWGRPKSQQRKRRLTSVIASLIHSTKRKSAGKRFANALKDWTSDLQAIAAF